MARSIGDHAAATVGVIAEPEISEYIIDEQNDYMLIIASDGVWELIESQRVAEIVQSVQSGDVQEICEEITQQVCWAMSPAPTHALPARRIPRSP